MSSIRQRTLGPRQLKTTTLRKRKCHVDVELLAAPPDPHASLHDFLATLPRLGASQEMLAAAHALANVAVAQQQILWVIDESFLDAGLSAILIRLLQRGFVKGVAMTGTAALRDFELAITGQTNEDLAEGLFDGLWGLSRESGEGMNAIINDGVRRGFGLGECLARGILDRRPPHYTLSVLAACAARAVPATVHVAVGADGFHRHPTADGQTIGKGSLKDAQILGARVESLSEGGAIVAAHRSPYLTDVLLGAFGATRNLEIPIDNITLVRFGECEKSFEALPGLRAMHALSGPIEINLPLLTGAVFSLVE